MKKAIIGLYRHDAKARVSNLVERIELQESLDALIRRKGWKAEVEAKVNEKGLSVISISIVHSGADLDVNIAVSVAQPPPKLGEKKKPVTRGGRPVDGPIKVGKTMAAKRRAMRGAPGK